MQNNVEKTMQKTSQTAADAASTMPDLVKEMGSTAVDVLDRLEGTQSKVKLTFEELTLDTGVFKGSLTGAVVFSVNHAHE